MSGFLSSMVGASYASAVVPSYDIGNLTYVGSTNLTATHGAFALGLDFSSDGTKMYVASSTYDTVYQYTLSTPSSTSSASYASKSMSFSDQTGIAGDITFNSTGTKVYIPEFANIEIHQYNLSTAWDISTGTFSATKDISANTSGMGGIFLTNSGSNLYVADYSSARVRQYSLSTPDSISSATFVRSFTPTQTEGPRSVFLNPTGTKMFLMANYTSMLDQYSLSTPFDISTASYVKQFSLTSYDNTTHGFKFSADGTKLYVIENNGVIFEFTVG
jgi:6-phosphogluconolactonase (cycloisomerase 2 family)